MSFALLRLASGGRPSASKESISMRLLNDGHLVMEHDQGQHGQRHHDGPRMGVVEERRVPAETAAAVAPERGVAVLERAVAPASPGEGSFMEYLHEELSPAALDKVLRIASQLQANQASSLAETGMADQVLTTKPDPNLPQQNVQERPKKWSEKAWNMYQKVYETLKPLRGGHLNVITTFAAMGLGPDNCILKLAYILYSHDDEDDYPYLPQHCGAGFAYDAVATE